MTADKDKGLHDGHRGRMREKLLMHGARVFATYELLEMLLYYVIPYKDTNPVAKRLMAEFGTLDGVLCATKTALMSVSGVGERVADFLLGFGPEEIMRRVLASERGNAALLKYPNLLALMEADTNDLEELFEGDLTTVVYIRLASALIGRRKSDLFKLGIKHTSREIEEYLGALLFGLSLETVYVLSVDSSGRVLASDFAGEGSACYSAVFPDRLLAIAKKRGATGVILAHNHPASDPTPSEDDIRSNEALAATLSDFGISLVRHYIFAGAEYCSFG